jgi:hypothetical protein
VLSIFNALPPYLGGKRKLVGEIFRHIPPREEAPVLIDAFLGGGSASLFAKARGYRVIANDVAERSLIVGKALIENDHLKLGDEDLLSLFVSQPDRDDLVEKNFSPDVFTTKHAQFLDNALTVAGKAEGTKQHLLKLLIVKYMLRMRPMGNFGARTIVRQMEAGEWENMNPNFVKDCLNRKVGHHPLASVKVLAEAINKGVFQNGQDNEVYKEDVFDFLSHATGDVVYFDPPYPGTTSYETALKVVDSVLAGRVISKPKKSVFSRSDGLRFMEEMFAGAVHIPHWVISYGNAAVTLDEVVRVVERFRKDVSYEEIRFTHLASLSSKEKREENREYIISAVGDR